MSKEKKLKNEKNVELRILIIGEPRVGKKSIAKRFKQLNCTETKETAFSFSKKADEENETEKNNIFYSDNELYENILEEEIRNKKRDKQRFNLMKYLKIYKIDLNSIEISFYPCAEAEPLPIDYYLNDDDDDNILFEKENRISLSKLFYEIAQIIMKPLSHHNNHLEILFLFCFDLGNINSFNQLKYYYSQINKNFIISKNYYSILVGNKLDKKKLNDEFLNNINNFVKESSLKYFEISTYMFFNFENFFEKIFFLIFGDFVNFSTKSFKNNFHNILEQKPTFLLSERKVYPTNSNPSPNEYNNNPYEYPERKTDFFKLFKKNEKYNKKIFINKEGPIFPPLSHKKANLSGPSFENKKNNEVEKKNLLNIKSNNDIFPNGYNITKVDIVKEKSPIIWDSNRKNEIKDFLKPISKIKGYSIGVTTSNLQGIKQTRREKNKQTNLFVSQTINNGFHLNRANIKIKGALSQEKYDESRKEKYREKLDEIKRIENDINERHKKNIELNNDSLQEKVKKVISKEKKYLLKYIKKEKEKIAKQKKAKRINIINSFSKKTKTSKSVFYSPILKAPKNKGFSFGQKLDTKIKVESPDFPNLLDDFEKIVAKNSTRKIVKGAERFPRVKSEIYEDTSNYFNNMKEKQKMFNLKRNKFIKNKIDYYIKDRKNKESLVSKNKELILKEEEKELNNQILKKYNTTKDYFTKEVNYDLVEYTFPKYTIKGKYKYNSSLSYQSYYGSSDDIFNPYEKDNSYIRKRKFKNKIYSLETSNLNYVKPKYPAFSFGSGKRFKTFNTIYSKSIDEDKNKLLKFTENSLENSLFRDGNFGNNDTKSFLKAQTMMGTAKKFTCYKDNGVPGPGNYNIRTFADEISKNGEIINQIRKTIKEKEKIKIERQNI